MYPRHSRIGSRNRHAWEWRRGPLLGCLTLMAVGLLGCGEPPCGPFDPDCRPPPPPRPFDLNVVPDEPDPNCLVDLTASTIGGKDGTYAVWGDLRARRLDPSTGKYEEVRHLLGQPSSIFGEDRIRKGDAQFGEIDLRCFIREPGEEAVVKLEFRYSVVEDGAPVEGERSLTLELKCR